MDIVYQWIDLIWLPIALFVVQKEQRHWVCGFFISCILMMRMQVEVMQSIGYETGLMNLLGSNVYDRGLVIYSIFYMLYLVLAHFSPNARGPMLMAASISIFFMAFFTSTFIMVL